MKKEESSSSRLTVMAFGFCPRNEQVIAFRGRKAASNMRSRGTHGYAVSVVVKVWMQWGCWLLEWAVTAGTLRFSV